MTVPTDSHNTHETPDAIRPDVPYAFSSVEFFAGKDPLLDKVMRGDIP